jgi:hypothetical protein
VFQVTCPEQISDPGNQAETILVATGYRGGAETEMTTIQAGTMPHTARNLPRFPPSLPDETTITMPEFKGNNHFQFPS